MPDETPRARAETFALLVLRAFYAQFWLLQWFGKLRDQESGIVALKNLGIWSQHTTEWFVKLTPLPAWAVAPYTTVLPWCELTLGLLFLLGLRLRLAFMGGALLLLSLDVGLMLQLKHEAVATNHIHLLSLLIGLWLCDRDRWSLDARFAKRA
ncbi:MAG: DoxX family membrane protein [Deltaproteobacteria bacterium]|nr:DoxX family membrane protein [Deltaproteobacteria bacterium]